MSGHNLSIQQYLGLTIAHLVRVWKAEHGLVDHAIREVRIKSPHCRLQVAELI